MSGKATSLSLLERLHDSSDGEAWRQFDALYGPLIRQWLTRRGVQPQDADDVRQEVLQKAICELPEFRHNGRVGALRCWLRQVVANRLKTFWRQQRRHVMAAGGSDYRQIAEQLEDPCSALSECWDVEYQTALRDRLLDLIQGEFQPQTVQAFQRVAIEGQSVADVAEDLGMSVNAVRIAQSRVLRRMRELGQGMLD